MSRKTGTPKAEGPAIPGKSQAETAVAAATPTLLQRAQMPPSTLTPKDVKHLQRTIGNRATVGLLSRALPIQTKLTLGPAGDKYEQEADQVAAQVVRQIDSTPVQRQEEEEELQMKPFTPVQRQEDEEELQMKPSSPIQRQEDEDELQMKPSSPVQRQEDEDELQMKPLSPVQRQEDEEELQMKPLSPVQRQEDDEELQMKPFSPVQRQEDEDELQMKPSSPIQRQEDEEELQMKPLSPVQRQEDEEELQMKPSSPIQRQEDEEELQMKPVAADISRLQRTPAEPIRRAFVIQREIEEEEMLQGKYEHGPEGGEVEPSVTNQIQAARGGGRPLDEGVRGSMENGFGADFSGVRVHTGTQADSLNRSLNARAFTVGSDIFFKGGEYNPGNSGGQKLLAHELTHTVQQGAAGVRRTMIQRTPTKRGFVVQRRYTGSVLDYEQLKKDKKGGDAVPTISGFTKKGLGTGLSDLIKGMYTLIFRDDVTIDQLRTQLGLVRAAFVTDKQTIKDAGSATPEQKSRADTVFDKWIQVVDDNLTHLNTPIGGAVTEDKLIKELRRAYNDHGGIKPGNDLPEVANMLEVRFQNRQDKERSAAELERNARVTQHYEENAGAVVLAKVQDLEFLATILPQLPEPFRAPDLPQRLKDLAEPLIIQAVAAEKDFDEISSEVQRAAKATDPKPKLGVFAAKFFTAAQSAARSASDQAIAPVAAPAKDAATLAQEFLDSREIYKIAADAMPKQDRIAFSAALRKVRIIKQLLTPDEVPEEEVVVATWKDDRNLQDDVRSEKENNRDVAPDVLDAMRRKVAEANDFFKRFVAPQFLSTLVPPIVAVHAKPSQSLLAPKGFRAYQTGQFVHLAQDEDTSIIVHEVGHYVENNLPPEAWMDIRDLINKRHAAAGGGTKADTGDSVFTRDEGRFKGDYPATGKYTSRAYADEGSTEMTSMTLEYLSDPKKIDKMIDKDPQQAAIIIRALNPDAYNAVPDLVQFAKYLPNPTRRRR